MPTYYVNSGAGGANNGTSWTDAWTALSSSTGAGTTAGDEVRVHKTHSETIDANTTYNWSGGTVVAPVKIVCVDKDASDALSTGATVALGTGANRALSLQGNIYVDGMTFTATGIPGWNSGTIGVFHNCTIGVTGATARSIGLCSVSDGRTWFVNCTFDISNAVGSTVGIGTARSGAFLRNCTITTAGSHTTVIAAGGTAAFIDATDCDIGAATNLATVTAAGQVVRLRRCKLGTFTNYTTGTIANGYELHVEQCVSGTISDVSPTFTAFRGYHGDVTNVTAQYRTGGAGDGTNTYSWKMEPNGNAEEQIHAVRTPPMSVWVAGGSSKTFTVFISGGAEMYDDEVWMELEGPDDTASPNTSTQGYWYSSRLAWRGTRAVLTTDGTSTWNGTGTGTNRKISCTYTPQENGPVVIRVAYAKTSGAAIYVDPIIVVT